MFLLCITLIQLIPAFQNHCIPKPCVGLQIIIIIKNIKKTKQKKQTNKQCTNTTKNLSSKQAKNDNCNDNDKDNKQAHAVHVVSLLAQHNNFDTSTCIHVPRRPCFSYLFW